MRVIGEDFMGARDRLMVLENINCDVCNNDGAYVIGEGDDQETIECECRCG